MSSTVAHICDATIRRKRRHGPFNRNYTVGSRERGGSQWKIVIPHLSDQLLPRLDDGGQRARRRISQARAFAWAVKRDHTSRGGSKERKTHVMTSQALTDWPPVTLLNENNSLDSCRRHTQSVNQNKFIQRHTSRANQRRTNAQTHAEKQTKAERSQHTRTQTCKLRVTLVCTQLINYLAVPTGEDSECTNGTVACLAEEIQLRIQNTVL